MSKFHRQSMKLSQKFVNLLFVFSLFLYKFTKTIGNIFGYLYNFFIKFCISLFSSFLKWHYVLICILGIGESILILYLNLFNFTENFSVVFNPLAARPDKSMRLFCCVFLFAVSPFCQDEMSRLKKYVFSFKWRDIHKIVVFCQRREVLFHVNSRFLPKKRSLVPCKSLFFAWLS